MTKKRITLSVVAILALGVGGYVAWSSNRPPTQLPQDFVTARQHVGEMSQKIVEITAEVGDKVKLINRAEVNGDHEGELLLLRQARDSNAEAYQQAVALAEYLQTFASSLSKISSADSQQLAYQAVSMELSLVSEYIVYTADLNTFFDNLGKEASTGSDIDRKAVQDSLTAVNQKAADINTINQSFISKMREFDQSL
jgi:hypothetical protein